MAKKKRVGKAQASPPADKMVKTSFNKRVCRLCGNETPLMKCPKKHCGGITIRANQALHSES